MSYERHDCTFLLKFTTINIAKINKNTIILFKLKCPLICFQMQLSEVIARTRCYFKCVTGTEENMALLNVSPEFLEHKLEDCYNISTEKKEVQAFFEHMDYDKKGYSFFKWTI